MIRFRTIRPALLAAGACLWATAGWAQLPPAAPAPAAQGAAALPGETVQAEHDRALALDVAGRSAEAIPIFQDVIARIERASGPNDPTLVVPLANLATAQSGAGDLDKAEASLKRALSIAEREGGGNAVQRGRLLANLASLSSRRGAFQTAEQQFQQSDALLRQVGGLDRAIYLTERASHDLRMGRASAAEREEQESLRLKQAAKAGPQDRAESLNNLGVIYLQMGRFTDAERQLREALSLWEQSLGPDHPRVADALTNLSDVYTQTARFGDALQVAKRALRIRQQAYGENHPKTAAALNNLSSIYLASGNPARAAELSQEALQAMVKGEGASHPDVAVALDNVGELLLTQKRGAEAVKVFQRALQIRVAAFGKDHPAVASSLLNVGRFLFDAFQAEPANAPQRPQEIQALETLFSRADAIVVQSLGPDHPWRVETQSRLALLWREQGRMREAMDAGKKAADLAIEAYQHSGAGSPDERRRSLGQYRAAFEAYLTVLSDPAARSFASGDAAEQAFEMGQWAQITTASLALQQAAARVAGQRTDALGGVARAHQAALDKARSLDKRLIEAVSLPPGQRNAEAERQAQDAWKAALDEVDRTEAQLRSAYPQYYAAFHFTPASVRDVQAALRPNEVLVNFVLTPAKSFVWAIGPAQVRAATIPAGADQIKAAVKAVRAGIDVSKTGSLAATGFDAEAAHRLYSQLFPPVQAAFGAAREMIVVPDRDLFSLPMGLLVTDPPPPITGVGDYRNVHWMIQKYALTTLPSARALQTIRTLAKPSQAPRALLGIGNPDFRTPSAQRGPANSVWARDAAFVREKIRPLEASGAELGEMAKLLGAANSLILTGAQASEGNFERQALRDYRIVAFSTHALMTGEIPFIEEPALILSPPPVATERDDGVLTASEIAGLSLDADLVILSACNTAAPGAQSAEGLSGLARAFFFAGSRALLVSNWYVEDRSASLLTTGMLAALRQNPGTSRAEALRQSMLKLMSDPTQETFAHPYFWAPFTLVGEGGPI